MLGNWVMLLERYIGRNGYYHHTKDWISSKVNECVIWAKRCHLYGKYRTWGTIMDQCFFWGRNILFHELKITDETRGYKPDGEANFPSQELILTGNHTLITVKNEMSEMKTDCVQQSICLEVSWKQLWIQSGNLWVNKRSYTDADCSQIKTRPFDEEFPCWGDDIAHGKKPKVRPPGTDNY